jgi:Concanavalin A-like lectin/glucanases superfamily/Domain of unknown function (DUF2341)
MTCVRRSVARARVMAAIRSIALAAPLTACGFGTPGYGGYGDPGDPGGSATVDAPLDSPAVDPAPGAWLEPWTRRKPITLLQSKIDAPGNGTLTDFPVLVSITVPELATSALATGADIVFTDDTARTLLASEIESFSPSTGELVAWVKVPNLSATADTTLFVYYGNANPPARTPETVWTASYLGVWHLQQDPDSGNAGDIKDATSGNRDGTAADGMTASDSVPAQIGRGLRFDGDDGALTLPKLNVGSKFTISMWVNFAGGNSVKTLMANSQSGRDVDGFRFFVNSANMADRRLLLETGSGNLFSGQIAYTNTNAVALNAPTHVAAVVDRAAATARLYVNGSSAAVDMSISNNFRTDREVQVGQMEGGGLRLGGTLDEIQLSSTLRSPEWIKTSFNNQSQPQSFYIIGAEQFAP